VRLGAVTVNSGADLVICDEINAATFTQANGGGTTTIGGPLNTSAAGGIGLNGNIFAINDTVTTTGDGTFTLTNAGQLIIAGGGDLNLDGAFLQNGAGAVQSAGDIDTSNDGITFQSAVTLAGNVAFSTNTGNGDILFNSTLDAQNAGVEDINLSAGTGTVTFNDAVGAGVRAGAITINGAAGVTAVSTIDADSITITNGGAVDLNGAVDTTGEFNSSSTNFDNSGASITTNDNDLIIACEDNLTLGALLNAGAGALQIWAGSNGDGALTLGGGLVITSDDLSFQAGNGNGPDTTASIDLVSNAPTFLGAAGLGTSPRSFTLQQDAAITDADIPVVEQFGDGIDDITYTLQSDDMTVTVGANVKLAHSKLNLTGADGVTVNGALSLNSLSISADNDTDGTGNVTISQAINTNGGLFSSLGVNLDNTGGTINTGGGDLTINHTGATVLAAAVSSGAGDIDIDTTGTLNVNSTINTTSGDLTLDSDDAMTFNTDGDITTTIGNVNVGANRDGVLSTAGDVTTANGNITFTKAVTLTGPVAAQPPSTAPSTPAPTTSPFRDQLI